MSSSTPAVKVSSGTRPHDDSPRMLSDESGASRATSKPDAAGSATNDTPNPQDVSSNAHQGNNNHISSSVAGRKGTTKLSRKDTLVKDGKDNTPKNGAALITPSPPAIDPLSHHIFVRTNTDRTIPSHLRSSGRPDSPAATNEGLPRPSSDLATKQLTATTLEPPKEKKKGNFLSRLSMIGNKKKDDDYNDDASEVSERRTEGANAVVFSSAVEAGGYIPHHKEPPRYIRVRSHNKKLKEFNRMFLAQELVGTRPLPDGSDKSIEETSGKINHALGSKNATAGGPVWAVEFSKDGKYLATAGKDRIVRIWAVMSSPEDRKVYDEYEIAQGSYGERLSAPVFHPNPVRELVGHTGEILALSWSKNNFLLSSSMDKTVRLWHMSRQECLCTFKHKDFVTSIAFHPRDDRFFLAGSLDSVLRLWSIPDKAVAYSSQLADLITAVAFSPDGKTCIAGCLNGLCTFYETEGLKFQTQIHVRSSRGKNAKGSKITGIQAMAFPPNDPNGEVKVLITSNDSRIRIYGLHDKLLDLKFKGHENTCNQIRASFSDDGNYIICGSEDRKSFIWSTATTHSTNKEKRPYEYFEAHPTVVTQAIFVPTATRQLLQSSHDPVFTLCNPPPVTLLSMEESTTASQSGNTRDQEPAEVPGAREPEQTPAFVARSKHHCGNIIVTADQDGMIKVFRQDCAFVKRRHDNWETGSSFSRKLGREGVLGRSGSIVTRTSASSVRDPHSRRGSVSKPASGLGTQMSPDNINSWRQNIEGTASRPNSIVISTPTRSERSISPAKARTPVTSSAATLASEARRQPYAKASPNAAQPTSPTASIRTVDRREPLNSPSLPPTPSFSFRSMDDDEDELRLDPAGASYSFWNLNRWRNFGGTIRGGSNSGPSSGSLQKGHNRAQSEVPEAAAALMEPIAIPDSERRKSLGSHALAGTGTGTPRSSNESARPSRENARSSREMPHRRKSMPLSSGIASIQAAEAGRLTPPNPSRPRRSQSGTRSRLSSEVSSECASEESEDMQCSKCGGHEFKAKKVGGRQRLLCAACGRMADA
ncbi:WD repeat-containing protein [Apiospora kogelbergensis]|uniref:WD repeat-containing protein n=1 Tax=Apiospora kogelbergensis TaxID=1337665 RepID=A0AAW0QEH1_9PEZI